MRKHTNLTDEITRGEWKGEQDGDYKFMFIFFAIIILLAFAVYGYSLITSLTM